MALENISSENLLGSGGIVQYPTIQGKTLCRRYSSLLRWIVALVRDMLVVATRHESSGVPFCFDGLKSDDTKRP